MGGPQHPVRVGDPTGFQACVELPKGPLGRACKRCSGGARQEAGTSHKRRLSVSAVTNPACHQQISVLPSFTPRLTPSTLEKQKN